MVSIDSGRPEPAGDRQRLRAVRPRQRVQAADERGAGKTVAIVDAYDDPNAEPATWPPTAASSACRPAPPPTAASRRSTRTARPRPLPVDNTGWAGEIALDIDMVSAICPNCHILLVEASSPTTGNLGTAVNTAVAWAPIAVSNSYGGAGEPRATRRTTPRTTSTRASRSPSRPATAATARVTRPTSPYVTAVGGTSLHAALATRAAGPRPSGRPAHRGRRQRLLGATRRSRRSRHDTGCAQAHDRRRLRGRRPGHRRRRLRHLRRRRLDGVRRHQRRRRRSSPRVYALAGVGRLPATTRTSYPYATHERAVRRDERQQRLVLGSYLCTAAPATTARPASARRTASPRSAPARTTGTTSRSRSARRRRRSRPARRLGTVSTAVTSGSAQTVSLSASGLPTGATASFSPSSVTAGARRRCDLDLELDPAGTYR